jgi:hypothetical protein
VLVDDLHGDVAGLDGHGLACVANADLYALPGNLDAVAAGHLPLDRQPRGRERIWPGQADALDPLPLVGRDGAGKGAPQDAVIAGCFQQGLHSVLAQPAPLKSGSTIQPISEIIPVPASCRHSATDPATCAASSPGMIILIQDVSALAAATSRRTLSSMPSGESGPPRSAIMTASLRIPHISLHIAELNIAKAHKTI